VVVEDISVVIVALNNETKKDLAMDIGEFFELMEWPKPIGENKIYISHWDHQYGLGWDKY
jgi:hypothetical protein